MLLYVFIFIVLIIAGSWVYTFNKRQHDKKIIAGLPEAQQEIFFDNISKGADDLIILIEENANDPLLLSKIKTHIVVTTVDGLVNLSTKERDEVAELFDKQGVNPIDKDFVAELNNRFAGRYAEKFNGFVSSYQQKSLTDGIPFPKMYTWVVENKFKQVEGLLTVSV